MRADLRILSLNEAVVELHVSGISTGDSEKDLARRLVLTLSLALRPYIRERYTSSEEQDKHRCTMAKGTLRFGIPDESVPAEERALFAIPQNKDFVPKEVELHDFRTSPDVVQGPKGLDVQGFTYVKHKSNIIGTDQLFEGRNIDEVYLPEVEQLMKEVTGAREVVVWNGVTRRKLPAHQDNNPTVQHKKGGELDKTMDKMPRDSVFSKHKRNAYCASQDTDLAKLLAKT